MRAVIYAVLTKTCKTVALWLSLMVKQAMGFGRDAKDMGEDDGVSIAHLPVSYESPAESVRDRDVLIDIGSSYYSSMGDR